MVCVLVWCACAMGTAVLMYADMLLVLPLRLLAYSQCKYSDGEKMIFSPYRAQ